MPRYTVEILEHVNHRVRIEAPAEDLAMAEADAIVKARKPRTSRRHEVEVVLVDTINVWLDEGFVCGECGSDDLTIPADGSEILCHACETSCPLDPSVGPVRERPDDDADALRREVVDALVARGVKAEHWHSGGGIVGVRVELGSGADLFTTLEADGPANAWTLVDLSAADGEYVAGLEIQVRPLGSDWTPVGEPGEFAAAIEDLVLLMR